MKFCGGRHGELPKTRLTIPRAVLELFQHRSCISCPYIVKCLGFGDFQNQARFCLRLSCCLLCTAHAVSLRMACRLDRAATCACEHPHQEKWQTGHTLWHAMRLKAQAMTGQVCKLVVPMQMVHVMELMELGDLYNSLSSRRLTWGLR